MPPLVRLARLVLPAVAVGIVVAIQAVYFQRGFVPGDAFNYLAAGERLNDGHLLYALSPGDRYVAFQPPFWTVPLLSPPPIAVLFRPLAALPGDLGVYIWWVACIVLVVGTIAAMLRRRPIGTSVIVLVLSVPIVYEIGVGNLNALVLSGLVGGWVLLRNGRDGAAGAIFALLAALKLTPAIVVWWLITQQRFRAVRAFAVAAAVITVISVLGAGVAAHLEYLGIVRQTTSVGTSVLSLAGLARFLGVPPDTAALLPPIAVAIGLIAVWRLRDRPRMAYSVIVVTMIAGSPVVYINWYALLLAAWAPAVWPVPARDAPEATG